MLSSLFLLLTLFILLLIFFFWEKDYRMLITSIIWLTIVGVLVNTNFFRNTDSMPPRFLVILVGGTALCVLYYQLLKNKTLNLSFVLLLHVVRIPVELALHQLYQKGYVPKIMTYEGWNFDILMGISALILFSYLILTKKQINRQFMILWNVIGIIMLTIIVVTAILSAPFPFQQFAFDQPNIALLRFPFIYLPAYIVPMVYLAHVMTLNKLMKSK